MHGLSVIMKPSFIITILKRCSFSTQAVYGNGLFKANVNNPFKKAWILVRALVRFMKSITKSKNNKMYPSPNTNHRRFTRFL